MSDREENIADLLKELLDDSDKLQTEEFHKRLTDIRLCALTTSVEESHESDIIHYACRSVEEYFKEGPANRRREIALEDILNIRGLDGWRRAFR